MMKTQKIKKVSLIVVAVLMFLGSNSFAQQGKNYDRQGQRQGHRMEQKQSCKIPDLTEEQEAKINELRLAQTKEMTAFRNQINELRAEKQTLLSTDNTDLKEINAKIDQITEVHNKMMKASVKHHQEVRNLLTDEQKISFDSRPMHRGNHNKGMKGGRGRSHMARNS